MRRELNAALAARIPLKLMMPAMLAMLVVLARAPQARAYSNDQIDSVTSKEESEIGRVRDQEITQLKIVLGRRFGEDRRPDILLRLAELYIENYRFYFFKENQIHQILYKQGVKERVVNHDRSRVQIQAATNACLAILKSRVPFAKMDEVFYFLGYNSEEMGRHKEAAKYFLTIVTRYPNSVYASEAFRNLAEYEFEEEHFQKALSYYEKAAQYTGVPSYPRTLYKLAWAYFKTRRKGDALDTMKKVIEISGKEDKFVGLRDEAMNDIVMFFSEAGRMSEAHDFFAALNGGPEVYAKALGKLSAMYDRRGDHKLAIKVNEGLIDEYGDKHPDLVYDALAKNVELYRRGGDATGESNALRRLVDFLSRHADDIAKANGDGAATYARTKSYLRGRATEVHKQARTAKSKDAATRLYSRAADLYQLYVKAFLANPTNPKDVAERTEIDAYRSDALLRSGREGDAMPELELTLMGKGDAKTRKDAGTQLLNMLIKRINANSGKPNVDAETSFYRVSDEYEQAFPDDKLVAELHYKKARMAAVKSGPEGLSPAARDALVELIAKFPDRPEAAESARDLVNDLLKRKKTDEATALAKTYLANAPLMAAGRKIDLQTALKKVVERQQFVEVAASEKDASKSDDLSKTASSYEQLADSSKDPEVAAKALNNAAVDLDRSGQTNEAFRVYLKLLQRFPNNTAPKADLARLAAQLLWKSRFAESAGLYTRLAGFEFYSRDERLSSARTAFTIEWGLGDVVTANTIAGRALNDLCGAGSRKGKKKPSHHRAEAAAAKSGGSWDERCDDFVFDLVKIRQAGGQNDEAIAQLKWYLAKSTPNQRRAEASYLIGKLYALNQDGRKAGVYYEDALRSVLGGKSKGDRRERNFAAHAAFLMVEPYFTQFAALKLDVPEDRLKAVMRKKLSDLESLVTRYTSVVKYGDGEWGLAALERLYDAFSSFSAALEALPAPARLQGPQIEAYKRGIQSVSQPMSARAGEYLEQAYQKGLELGVTTPTFIAVTQRLARNDPKTYPPAHYSMSGNDDSVPRQSSLRLAGTVETADAEELKNPAGAWRTRIAAKLAQSPKNAQAWVELANAESLSGHLKVARMLYEQAISLNPRSGAALNGLSVILFLDNDPLGASQGLKHAAEVAESNAESREVKLNLAKTLLAYHHFGPALSALRGITAAAVEGESVSKEAVEAQAIAELGAGQLAAAGTALKSLDADDSKKFNLWYNWAVWTSLTGDKDSKEKSVNQFRERGATLAGLEKAQAELCAGIFK